MAKNDFQYRGWNYYTLQRGTIMTLISPGDCTLAAMWHCHIAGCSQLAKSMRMWLWNHDSEFTKRKHPALWHVGLGSWHWIRQVAAPCNVACGSGIHAMEFAQTSAILKFYIWFQVWPYHWSRHVILHQFAKFYPNQTTLSSKKWRQVDFQNGRSQPSWILGANNGFLE